VGPKIVAWHHHPRAILFELIIRIQVSTEFPVTNFRHRTKSFPIVGWSGLQAGPRTPAQSAQSQGGPRRERSRPSKHSGKAARLKCRKNQDHAQSKRIGGYQPDNGQRTGSGLQHQSDPKCHRRETSEKQRELPFKPPSQSYRGEDFQYARGNRPVGNIEQQGECCDSGYHKGQDADT